MRRYSAVYLKSLNRREADPFSGCYIASKWDAFLLWPGRASFSVLFRKQIKKLVSKMFQERHYNLSQFFVFLIRFRLKIPL